MPYLQRIGRLQAILRRRKIDGLLVSQPENRRYLSGYSTLDHGIAETAGLLLIPARGESWLLTDFRFKLQAEAEAGFLHIGLYPKGVLALLREMMPDLGIHTLGFESEYSLYSFAEKLKVLGAKIGLQVLPTTGLVEKMRLVKDEDELAKLRAAVDLNEKVFEEVYSSIAPGQTENEIALAIESTMRRMGAESPSFSTIVAAGSNSALPHAVPGPALVQRGQPVMIDMGLILEGYCSDMTRTFVLGEPDERFLAIHRLVRRAQLAAISSIREGVVAAKVDKIARNIIAAAGYAQAFGHSLGHGVGLAVHEEPRLSSRNRKQLRAGMVVTVEPGVYIPGWGGVRLENMVVVREDGCELLNKNSTWLDI
ncbi:MAG: aminopeptidase P family protein [Pseudomonadota bacterium]